MVDEIRGSKMDKYEIAARAFVLQCLLNTIKGRLREGKNVDRWVEFARKTAEEISGVELGGVE